MSAILQMHQKKVFKNGFVLEIKIWEIKKSKVYPEGFKYRLIFIDPNTNEKVLMDNHSPKGHHYHIDEQEYDYPYESITKLISDFKSLVNDHMGVKL